MVASKVISIAVTGSLAWVTHPDGCFHPSDSVGPGHELAVKLAPFLLPDGVADSLRRGSGFGPRMKKKKKISHLTCEDRVTERSGVTQEGIST